MEESEAVNERVTKAELLDQIRTDRARFDSVLDQVPHERLTEPALPGGWSVKDILAHIAWGEREALGVMRARELVGSELWNVPQDERNAAVVFASRDRSLDEVVDDYRSAFEEYLAELEQMAEDELNEPERIRGLTEGIPGWRPWRVLYDPDHYEDHARTIEVHLLPPAG